MSSLNFEIGEDVLYAHIRGVVRYKGEVVGSSGIWLGVELNRPVGISDGEFRGQRYFTCATNCALFCRSVRLRPFTEREQAAVKIQKRIRGFVSRRKMNVSFTVGQAPEEKAPSTSAATQPKSSYGGLSHIAAVMMIQRALRGKEGREKAKKLRLWKAWNALDTKEEKDLVHTHEAYEKLKENYQKAIQGEDSKTLSGASSSPTAVSSSPLTSSPSASGADSAIIASTSRSKLSTSGSKPAITLRESDSLPQIHGPEPTVMENDVPRLPAVITLDFVTAVMDHFKNNGQLHYDDVIKILQACVPMFSEQPNIVEVHVHTRMTVVGDIHGQLDDLFTIFKLNGLPSLRNSYLFNGDFVDRGQNSVECIIVLLCFKLLYPDNFFMNRGNHEARDINSRDGFESECISKYGIEVFDLFSEVFACLPLATILNQSVYVVHGGLGWDDLTLTQLQEEDRYHQIPPIDSVMEQMLWSDPHTKLGRADNPRGASLVFGPDVVQTFLRANNLSLVVRSHECQPDGFNKMFNDSLITVFSASNYCGVAGNEGAFLIFDKNMDYKVVQFAAKPKEKMSRYRMRHALIENDVISKLLRRIAENRLALVDYYSKLDKTKAGTITRLQWSEGLKHVLALDIPFLEFQGYLGLPKLGVSGTEQGKVDFMSFLDRYRIHISVEGDHKHEETGPEGEEVQAAIEQMADLLFKNRYELESLFRYFDANGDGSISLPEFREGVRSLRSLFNQPLSDAQIDKVIAYMDKNGDGVIEYNEFFDSFQVRDPDLARVQRFALQQKKTRKSKHVAPI